VNHHGTVERTIEVRIYAFTHNKKIAAIKFVRELTRLRNGGTPTGLRESKEAVDYLEQSGNPICVPGVPEDAIGLVRLAAEQSGVTLDRCSPRNYIL
jgi:hypothetical protein